LHGVGDDNGAAQKGKCVRQSPVSLEPGGAFLRIFAPFMPETRRHWWTRKCLLGANLAAPLAVLATRFQQPAVIAAAAVAHGAFAYAIMRPQCAWFGPVVTRFTPRGREVWLTIDDGPAGEASESLAVEMQRRGVRATFFVKGANLRAQPAVAQRILAAGHTLANHTQTHPAAFFSWLRPSRLRAEIDACNDALRAAGAEALRWFRSPVGLKHTRLHPALRTRGMRLIAWNVHGGDGLGAEPSAVAGRVAERATPGAIVLLHEGRPRSNEAILAAIDALRTRGFSFVIPDDAQLV
jgi:peptidoglycan/xylan/chitin deacetylase (PgdA/CDA1 family)